MLTVVPDVSVSPPADGASSLIDQIVGEGARQMLAAALQAEVAACIDQFAGVRDEDGRRIVVRNGTAEPRTVLTSAGAVEVTAPQVNGKRTDPESGSGCGSPRRSCRRGRARPRRSVRCCRCCTCLHGLSSGDFVPALGQVLGTGAGLSSSTVTKLTETWKAEAAAFMNRDLSQVDYVHLWVDGIHLGIRLEEDKLCLLVMIGVRADGRKELVALADGYREPAESWADLLRDCARRGMRAPVPAVGDGALGFWKATRERSGAGGWSARRTWSRSSGRRGLRQRQARRAARPGRPARGRLTIPARR
jgi:Transposase, Mutator family